MKLLIAGDSFAADWTKKYPGKGWPNILESKHSVTNIAQAGCGEYKIYQQLKNQKLEKYDAIIVSHTSPFRIHTSYHPKHNNDILHHNSDFIYEDVKSHDIKSVVEYFEQYFDLDQAKFVHRLICQEIDQLTKELPVLHIAHITWDDLYPFKMHNFDQTHKAHPGLLNHYSDQGNQIVAEELEKRLALLNFN